MKSHKKSSFTTIILTGLSGSGKTVALNAFEDSGFFCVDNLPSQLITTFVNLCTQTPSLSKIAIGVDIRDRKFLTNFSDIIDSLREKHDIKIMFLESTDEALTRRFKETRRPHPLGYKDLKKAILKEIKLLDPIRQKADSIVDTSLLTPHQLRNHIIESYIEKGPKEMAIGLISFGYKYSIPSEADLLFDVRFLPNPYFVKGLKELTGLSPKVKKFVLSQDATKEFFDKLYPLLEHIIPLYKKEGKSYLTIGIGCTGGQHRSPAIVQEISKRFKKLKLKTTISHRDMP
jgi:UPF0042 nucleotide-binding protein